MSKEKLSNETLNPPLRKGVVMPSLPCDEEIRTPIQDALYATGQFTTDDCDTLADGILQYIKDAGMKIAWQ